MELVKQTRTEVDRYRSMDRLIPSPHNIVTIAALEVLHNIYLTWVDCLYITLFSFIWY